jgi:hypothetical protein
MKIVLLIVAVLVAFMIFRGGSSGDSAGVESAVTAPKPDSQPQSSGAAPSPGNDPNLHNSPTRRLGF